MRPPIGVAILGVIAFVNGVADFAIGLQLTGVVAFGPVSTGNGVLFTGVLALVLGILWIALGYAAWTLRIWAWTFGMLLGTLGLLNAVFITIGSASVANGVAAAILPGLVLWYLNTESVKDAFVAGEHEAGRFADSYEREQAERITAERSED
jgi:hypothetical protein